MGLSSPRSNLNTNDRKEHRIEIRCRLETLTRWKVNLADSMLDGETYLNGLIDHWRLTHPGTMRPMPGMTFGQILEQRR